MTGMRVRVQTSAAADRAVSGQVDNRCRQQSEDWPVRLPTKVQLVQEVSKTILVAQISSVCVDGARKGTPKPTILHLSPSPNDGLGSPKDFFAEADGAYFKPLVDGDVLSASDPQRLVVAVMMAPALVCKPYLLMD